jgi:hypothetical protein
MLLAARRVVQVQHALRRTGFEALLERAGLAGLVAGHAEVMRDLVAGPAGDRALIAELAKVGGVGGDDPVIEVHHDTWLGQAVEERNQFAQEVRGHVYFVQNAIRQCQYCHQASPNCNTPAETNQQHTDLNHLF